MSKTNAIAVINDEQKNALTTYTGTLFSDIDFQGLNNIIDKIAENKEELTDGMREAATKFANDWDDLVVKRLEFKKEKLEAVEEFFSNNDKSYNNLSNQIRGRNHWRHGEYVEDDGVIYVIIDILKSNEKWASFAEKLEEIIDEYEELESRLDEDKPDSDDFFQKSDEDMSYSERVITQKEYELAQAQFNKQAGRARFELRTKYVKVRKEMRANKELQEFVKAMKAQLKKSRETISLVHEKSSLVKLAINFGGTDLLKALQELHEFQKTL